MELGLTLDVARRSFGRTGKKGRRSRRPCEAFTALLAAGIRCHGENIT
jgi:hypothetical protein